MNQVNHISSDLKENREVYQVKQWLQKFGKALESARIEELEDCFSDNAHWRDLLAFTWSISPFEGRLTISTGLLASQRDINARNFVLADGRTEPRTVTRLGIDVIEGIFTFETSLGKGEGIVRLLKEEPTKAWIFLTSLFELKGHEEKNGSRRPSGEAYSRNFGGSNWLDQRQ